MDRDPAPDPSVTPEQAGEAPDQAIAGGQAVSEEQRRVHEVVGHRGYDEPEDADEDPEQH